MKFLASLTEGEANKPNGVCHLARIDLIPSQATDRVDFGPSVPYAQTIRDVVRQSRLPSSNAEWNRLQAGRARHVSQVPANARPIAKGSREWHRQEGDRSL
jgi:hypothetical protein